MARAAIDALCSPPLWNGLWPAPAVNTKDFVMNVAFVVNGGQVEVQVEPRTTLADCLRYDLRLTGTHVGCAHGACGACTVMVDGVAVRSCLILAVQMQDATIVTIEGISNDNALTPLQAAFRKHFAL